MDRLALAYHARMRETHALPSFDGKAFVRTLTGAPGVYRMFDARDELLYVGKAGNLKKRVGSYFLKPKMDPRIAAMIAQIARVASGYIYYVSLKGVTGAATIDRDAVAARIPQIRQHARLPVGVGNAARSIARFALSCSRDRYSSSLREAVRMRCRS